MSQQQETILFPCAVIPIDQSPYSCIYKPSCPFSLHSQILSSYGKAPLCFYVPLKMLFWLPDYLTWPCACSVLALARSQGACELTYFLSYEVSASEIWYLSDVCTVLMNYCQQYCWVVFLFLPYIIFAYFSFNSPVFSNLTAWHMISVSNIINKINYQVKENLTYIIQLQQRARQHVFP